MHNSEVIISQMHNSEVIIITTMHVMIQDLANIVPQAIECQTAVVYVCAQLARGRWGWGQIKGMFTRLRELH